MAMQAWWDRWPGRLEAEIEAFRAAGHPFELDSHEQEDGRVVLVGTFPLKDGRPVRLRVVYPDTYPSTRFTVFAPEENLGKHQNPVERNLCLLPRDSDAWRPSFLAANIIRERLDLVFNPTLATDDVQGEPVSQFLRYWGGGCVVVPETAVAIPEHVSHGRFAVSVSEAWMSALCQDRQAAGPPGGAAFLTTVSDGSGVVVASADAELTLRAARSRWRTLSGAWARLPEKPAATVHDAITALNRLQATKSKKWGLKLSFESWKIDLQGVLLSEEIQQGVFGWAWIFLATVFISDKRSAGLHVRGLRYGPTTRSVRIPELRPLQEKTVSLLGVGALGASIAEELARAQIRELRIADFDYVDPAGGARWVSELEGAGAEKTGSPSRLVGREPHVS